MTYNVFGGTLNPAQPNPTLCDTHISGNIVLWFRPNYSVFTHKLQSARGL